jgi:5'-AMP-activated protein kinase catalytic alpha subunit
MPYQAPFVDIWSAGIILFAMLCGYLPFEGENNEKLYENIMKGEFDVPNYLSDKAKDLIKKILITDPKKRFTVSQIKTHPWFHLYKNEYGKIIIYEGLLLTEIVIPIDEEIVKEMIEKYNFGLKKEEIRIAILSNKHNDITTIYYLLLNNRIRKGKKSLCDLKSYEFKKYIQNKENLFENYEFDINKLIEERKKGLNINKFYSHIGTNKNSSTHLKTPKLKNRNDNNNNLKELKNYKTNFQFTSPNSSLMKKNNSKNIFHSGSKPKISRKVINKNLIFSPVSKRIELHSYFSDKFLQVKNNKKNIYNKTETNTEPKFKQSKMLLSPRYKSNLNNDFKNIKTNNYNNIYSINNNNNYRPFITDHKIVKKYFDINNILFEENALIDLACLNYNNKNELFEKIINLCSKFKYNYRKINDNKIKIEYFIQNFSMEIKIIKDIISNYNIIKFKILKGNNEMFENISKKIINNIDIEKNNNV